MVIVVPVLGFVLIDIPDMVTIDIPDMVTVSYDHGVLAFTQPPWQTFSRKILWVMNMLHDASKGKQWRCSWIMVLPPASSKVLLI